MLGTGAFIAFASEPDVAGTEPPKITHENLYQMEELVEQGADPNAAYWLYPGRPCTDEIYPLYAAIQTRDIDLVRRLLALGAVPRGGQLQGAVWIKHPPMVEALVEAGADPNGMPNYPPLGTAGFRGNSRIVECLLAQPGIEVDKRNIDGYTALMSAAGQGHTRVVELLLEAGADPSLKNEQGQTAEDLARQGVERYEGVIERLGQVR